MFLHPLLLLLIIFVVILSFNIIEYANRIKIEKRNKNKKNDYIVGEKMIKYLEPLANNFLEIIKTTIESRLDKIKKR